MPNIEINDPYDSYIKNLIQSGLFATTSEVIKDALRLHMNHQTEAKQMAAIHAAIKDGEEDVKGGRTTKYSHKLIDTITADVIDGHD